jgi:4-hydroxyphenylpyruvate dioxygenase
VRAPDGTLVYLVGTAAPGAHPIWEDDFHLEPGGGAPRGGGGFGGVDHIAQALTLDMMDSFSLFYRAIFGLEPDAQWELPDPYGLVRSRAFTGGEGGAVRLPLNTSESGRTGTGRFVSAFAGAGVHHIAFCTADAAAATEDAMAHGAPLLDIPGNYYEDLGARLGLDDDALADLRRHHLLFDREGGGPGGNGTFRHAYTLPFQDRFFLEIAERKGGYDGFGAANAGARMAAQQRPQRR